MAKALINHIQTEPFEVIHIGSTAAKVGGKGIIDLSILYPKGQLNLAIEHLKSLGFQDQISAAPFPPERPRKDGAVLFDGKKYLIHIHAIEINSEEHTNQIKYRDYLLSDPAARQAYERSKRTILAEGVTEQDAYGKRKSPFVKSVLSRI